MWNSISNAEFRGCWRNECIRTVTFTPSSACCPQHRLRRELRTAFFSVLFGIGIGAGISTGSYVGIQLATGGQITASGLFFAAASGAFLGAVGALAAPLGGSLAESIGFKASSIVAKVISNSLVFGAAIDVGLASGQRDPVKLALSGGLAIVGGESGDALAGELGAETTGMTSLQQSGRFAPRIAAFLRVSPNAGGVVAGDIAGGILGGFLDYLYKLAEPGLP